MKCARFVACLLGVLLCPAAGMGQDYSGSYVFRSPQGPVELTLRHSGAQVTGVMNGANGMTGQIRSTVQDGRAVGTIDLGEATGWIAMGFNGGTLVALIADFNPATGEPNLDEGWRLDFTRTEGATVDGRGGAAAPGASGAPMASGSSPLVQQWVSHLRGKKLTYIDSYSSSDAGGYGGYSSRWEAYVCSDGTFHYRGSSSLTVDAGAYGAAGGGDSFSGTWRVIEHGGQPVLHYRRQDGGEEWARLSMRGGATYLDDMRVYVTADNNVCR